MSDSKGFSRRRFLQGVGAGAVAAGSLSGLAKDAQARKRDTSEKNIHGPDPVGITLDINGEALALKVEPRVTLLDALRNHLDLTGAKKVCDRATCGSCTVLLDGKAIYGCTLLAVEAEGHKVETVEGLSAGGLAPIQQAFVDNDALQCGFCTPGFVMACESLLRHNESPSPEEAIDGLGGNLCRCGTYVGIKKAVSDAARGGR